LDYCIAINDNIFNVISFTPSQTLSTGFIEFIVSGAPFGTTATTTNEEFQVRPNDFVVDRIFAEDFDEVQKFLLNRLIRPEYTAIFQVPQQNESDNFLQIINKLHGLKKVRGIWILNHFFLKIIYSTWNQSLLTWIHSKPI
jgi:hypothetical protein